MLGRDVVRIVSTEGMDCLAWILSEVYPVRGWIAGPGSCQNCIKRGDVLLDLDLVISVSRENVLLDLDLVRTVSSEGMYC
jgi:hypothetical protein